jgi:hypothetical protein
MLRRRLAWVVSEAPDVCRCGLAFGLDEPHECWRLKRKYSSLHVIAGSPCGKTKGAQNARIS